MNPDIEVFVVVHQQTDDCLYFDAVLPWGVKTFRLDRYEISQFRGATPRDVIEHLIVNALELADEKFNNLFLVFR